MVIVHSSIFADKIVVIKNEWFCHSTRGRIDLPGAGSGGLGTLVKKIGVVAETRCVQRLRLPAATTATARSRSSSMRLGVGAPDVGVWVDLPADIGEANVHPTEREIDKDASPCSEVTGLSFVHPPPPG